MQLSRGVYRCGPFVLLLILTAAGASGQQTYVTRFDQFDGYTRIESPLVSLAENGFHTQFGARVKTWVSVGVDYSVSKSQSHSHSEPPGSFAATDSGRPVGATNSCWCDSTELQISSPGQFSHPVFCRWTPGGLPSLADDHHFRAAILRLGS
jgi:hypothetical protein